MRIKWKLLTIASITTALAGCYIWAVPAIVNFPQRKVIIEQKIFETSGFKLDLGNAQLSMGAFPSVWIKSDNISVLNKNGFRALSVDNPNLRLKLLPLLFKKIEIDKISATSESAYFILTPEKEFFLGDYPLKFDNKNKNFSFERAELNLGPYNLMLDDKLSNQKASLKGEYLNDSVYIRDKKLKFATSGEIAIGGRTTDFSADMDLALPFSKLTDNKLKLNADIKDFELASISEYVNIISKGLVKELDGVLNFTADTISNKTGREEISTVLKTSNLKIIGKDEPSSIIFPDDLAFNINFETINNGVNFKNTTIEAKDIHIRVDGKLTDSGKKIPAMDLTAEAKPSRLERVCMIIPGLPDILPDMNLYALKQNFFYGDGSGKIRFTGNGSRPKVFGSVKLDDVYVVKRIPNTSRGGTVDLNFRGMDMDINVFVPTEKDSHVTVDGFIKIDGSKYSELDIKSEGDIPLKPAQEVINPLHEIFKFKMGPVPIMDIRGYGSIDVTSKGKKIDPHMWGTFKFKDATASFNDIKNLEINNAAGEITFNDTKIPFKTTSGTINGKNTQIYGECDVLGGMNVFAKTFGQSIPKILKVINSSKDMVEVQKVVKPFTKPDGIADIELNIYGTAKDAEKIEFNKDIFAKGKITFHNATTVLQDTFLPLNSINGVVNFDKQDADFNVWGKVRNSEIKVDGTANDKNLDLTASSDRIAIRDIMDMFQPDNIMPYKNEIGKIDVSMVGKYKGIADSDNIDYDKIVVDGKILSNINSSNPIKVDGGSFTIRHGVLKTDVLKGTFNSNPYTLSFEGNNIYKKMQLQNAEFNLKNFNIAALENVINQLDMPHYVKAQIENLTDFQGVVDIKGYIKDGRIWSDTNLNNLSFRYKPTDGLIKINSGKANMRGNILYLGDVDTRLSSMPLNINGNISNIFDNPNLNLSVSGELTQMFLDRFFNRNSVYPVKLKGNVDFKSKIKGTSDKLHTISELNINKNSSIYYMGATLEGTQYRDSDSETINTNPVSVIADTTMYPDKITLGSLKFNQYDKDKSAAKNQLLINGDISVLKDNILKFHNFKIKTFSPVSAKLFNIILKKPTIKQGEFNADLTVNGTSVYPNALGTLNIKGIDMPLFDVNIQDVDVDLKNDYLYINSKGNILSNDITLYAKARNNSQIPYVIEDIQIKADSIDLNTIAQKLDDYATERLKAKQMATASSAFSPEQIILKNAELSADSILIKKAQATDFRTNMRIDENHMLNVDKFSFDIANGTVEGDISTDLTNMQSNAHMQILNTDAQIISDNFFDMPGQMYGNVTGGMNITCNATSSVECLKTLSGDGHFEVLEGRMPKLGSLEYLLKAANLVTGGVTGVSINGIIDLITPLKTGNFESIIGDIKVENGVANDIEVYSHGKDLNMYMTGSYNLSNLIADMEIYGSLSKNFSTVLGKISNMSLNRLFNAIPGISINEITPSVSSNINKIPDFDKKNVVRVFKAEIYGDINGSNYVKSFRWIKH